MKFTKCIYCGSRFKEEYSDDGDIIDICESCSNIYYAMRTALTLTLDNPNRKLTPKSVNYWRKKVLTK